MVTRHFAQIVHSLRKTIANVSVEILTPDFRGRIDTALNALSEAHPNVFNHNIETVPSLYKLARPGADYYHLLKLLKTFSQRFPGIPTKSGLMLGLGESNNEVESVLRDLLSHGVSIVTLGQYLAPFRAHLPVRRYVIRRSSSRSGTIKPLPWDFRRYFPVFSCAQVTRLPTLV